MDRYDETARHLIDLGVGRTNFTNIVVAAEALDRGITVRKAESDRRMVLEHEGRMRTWDGGAPITTGGRDRTCTPGSRPRKISTSPSPEWPQ